MKIIPIFLPYKGCKYKCVFCNQLGATGVTKPISPSELPAIIKEYLKTGDEYEIAFYGGTFTGLPYETQLSYFEVIKDFIGSNWFRGVRISTRPDEITEEKVNFLKKYGVTVVEIGVQLLDDRVLETIKRGHTSQDVLKAIEILKRFGLKIGVHLMVGLPESSFETEIKSAKLLSETGVTFSRIHPTLVFENSELKKWYEKGRYSPLTLEEAIMRTSDMVCVFESRGIRVIRLGLHIPVEQRKFIVAGPYHPSFGDMVRARIIRNVVLFLKIKEIVVDENHKSWVFSYGNKELLKNHGVRVISGRRLLFDGKPYHETIKEYIRRKYEW